MYKVFLCGLDNSGKTSIVNSINKLPNPGKTIPTLNFNVAQVIIDLTEFVIWDAPGQLRYRDLWEKNIMKTQIICYIVDVVDQARYEVSLETLKKTLNNCQDETLPLIICFHKLDLDAKKYLPKVKEIFRPELFKARKVHYLETTIFNPNSIIDLKGLFVKIIEEEI